MLIKEYYYFCAVLTKFPLTENTNNIDMILFYIFLLKKSHATVAQNLNMFKL